VYLSYAPARGLSQVAASEVPSGACRRNFESRYYAIATAEEPVYAAMPASVAALFLSASGDVESANRVNPRPKVSPRSPLPKA